MCYVHDQLHPPLAKDNRSERPLFAIDLPQRRDLC